MSDHHTPILKLKNESGSESVHYSVLYEDFPEEFSKMAERELNETDEKRKQGLQRLKEFLKKEKLEPVEDYLLLAVLRNCKFNLKKSEVKLKRFLNKCKEIIQMVKEIDTDTIEGIIDDFAFGLLPYRDNKGRAIMYTRPYGMNLERYSVQDVITMVAVAVLFFMKYSITSVAGYAYFGEGKTPSVYLFYPILKSLKRIMFHVFAFPARVARVEVLNENFLCTCFIKIISPFVSKKILNRVEFHGATYDKLLKLYDPRIISEEFGGNMGPLNNEIYKQKLLDFVRELKKENV